MIEQLPTTVCGPGLLTIGRERLTWGTPSKQAIPERPLLWALWVQFGRFQIGDGFEKKFRAVVRRVWVFTVGIDIDTEANVDAGLFQSTSQSADTAKQIDRRHFVRSPRTRCARPSS